jgi:hypothetical protein
MTLSKLHSTVTQPIIDLFSTANHLFYWPYLLGSVFFAVYFLQKNTIKIKTKFSISQKKELKKDIFWAIINIYIFSLLVENIDLWALYIAVDLDLIKKKTPLKPLVHFGSAFYTHWQSPLFMTFCIFYFTTVCIDINFCGVFTSSIIALNT